MPVGSSRSAALRAVIRSRRGFGLFQHPTVHYSSDIVHAQPTSITHSEALGTFGMSSKALR